MEWIIKTPSASINCHAGNVVNLNEPAIEDISIMDIAHALANLCRFGGHTKEFYSVAQHCCLVSYLAPAGLRKAALLHDASEAYLGDVVKPLKILLGIEYEVREIAFDLILKRKFDLCADAFLKVKEYDARAFTLEYEYLIEHKEHTAFQKVFDHCWAPQEAKEIYLSTCKELGI